LEDAPLRLNDIQVIGSHNSYRRMSDPAILAAIARERPESAPGLYYDHPSLARQLDLGVRQVELDPYADPEGGHFADPYGETILKAAGVRSEFSPAAMRAPGFKIMHVPGLDYRTNCATLRICLEDLLVWSRAHPKHLPIVVTVDAKDQPLAGWPHTIAPLPLTPTLLDALDAEIRAVLPRDRLITPDDVRGSHATLREAVLAGGWPELAAARGKFMFIFDVRPGIAERYRAGHPSLAGRVMFSLYAEDQPEAATMIVQDPRGKIEDIRRLVRLGFYVRTRSDAGTREARTRDLSGARAAISAGAQAISSDYYPGAPDPLGLKFEVALPGHRTVACNPVRRGPDCRLPSE
jgi:hypothetical protein